MMACVEAQHRDLVVCAATKEGIPMRTIQVMRRGAAVMGFLGLVALQACGSEPTAGEDVERTGEAELAIESEFDCPAPNGTFEHEDCNKFWHCSNGIAYEKPCAAANPPLVFQEHPSGPPNEGRCVWPWESSRPECGGCRGLLESCNSEDDCCDGGVLNTCLLGLCVAL